MTTSLPQRLLVAGLLCCHSALTASLEPDVRSSRIVETSHGPVQGIPLRTSQQAVVTAYLGVPYARKVFDILPQALCFHCVRFLEHSCFILYLVFAI